MWLITAIAPVVIVGGIVVFVIKRLEHKYKNGKLGKKKSQKAQLLLDSFIPIGMKLSNWFDFRHVFPRFLTTFN